jgi:hypothetical protein
LGYDESRPIERLRIGPAAAGAQYEQLDFGLSFFSSAHLLGLYALRAAVWWGWIHDLRPTEYRTPSTFRVSGDSIQSNGKTFIKADIHRVIIKNGLTDEEVGIPDGLFLYRQRNWKVGDAPAVLTGRAGPSSSLGFYFLEARRHIEGICAYGVCRDRNELR